MKGEYKMTREDCEAKILEKLKEIRDIAKKYDKSSQVHLSMCIIGDDYISIDNTSKKFHLAVTLMDEEVHHFGD